MTVEELVALRKRAKLTQGQMAFRMGLGERAYQDIEGAGGALKARHEVMAERVLLARGVELKDWAIVPATVREDAYRLAALIDAEPGP